MNPHAKALGKRCQGCNGENSELTGCPVCKKMFCVYCLEADGIEHARSSSILDLQLFYDELISGQIIKESAGEPWPLTHSEANQICDALRERLSNVWPVRTQTPGSTRTRSKRNSSGKR